METNPNEEPVPAVPEDDYNDSGTPSFDYVRDRIENRFATATGATELAEGTPEGASLDQQLADRDQAAKEKLAQIRRSMRGE
ncbi:hypothetical protein SAMN05216266_105181 [Amycolatopsis marina]|uniref:PspA domain-containing protein n=1 Tax=Amycolatopsis marina TaxID=490629 RepID=A0A1I0YLC8_9PSEU|nr:hypothetical protein [Amycolatopsis marina]SFB14124.1 hypothetical protein SAMN05216266_105181 [Amycolatopsis marina]